MKCCLGWHEAFLCGSLQTFFGRGRVERQCRHGQRTASALPGSRAEDGERPHRFRDSVRPHILRISCGHAAALAQGACGCALCNVQTLPETLPGCPQLRICVHCGWMRSVSKASKAALEEAQAREPWAPPLPCGGDAPVVAAWPTSDCRISLAEDTTRLLRQRESMTPADSLEWTTAISPWLDL